MRLETPINHKRVARLIRENDLNSRVRLPRFKRCRLEPKIPDSRPCIDKLNREFFPKEPRKKLVTDMTFFHVEEGWLVLSTIKDLCTKEIIAWGFDTGATRELAETTLSKLAGLGPALLHSDQGTVYTAPLYRDLAKSLNIDLSYSRKGNCFGNACMENFYGQLKSETIYQMPKNRCYVLPRADLKQIIDKYIRWYNKERVSGEIRVPFPCKLLKI